MPVKEKEGTDSVTLAYYSDQRLGVNPITEQAKLWMTDDVTNGIMNDGN